MGMKTRISDKGDFVEREIPPPGNYLAVCNGVYLIGTQPPSPAHPEYGEKSQILLSFELHKRKGPARNKAGEVFEASAILSNTFSVSGQRPSNLAVYAGALRGRSYTADECEALRDAGGFDPENLLGKSCRLQLEHVTRKDGKIRDQIKTVAPLDPDDDAPPEGETDEVYWDWTLGVEVPKRIAWFWDRAAENPKRLIEVPPGKEYRPPDDGAAKYAAVAATIDTSEDSPF